MITYSAQEASKILGIDRHLMPVLFDERMLLGIKTGRGRRYSEKELEQFWDQYKGMDISNAEKIRIAAAIKRHEMQATGGTKKR